MENLLTLGIGRMEIDWGKYNTVNEYSDIFKPSDVKAVPYYYPNADSDEPNIVMKEGYVRKLSSIKNRLEMLGYNLESIKGRYEENVRDYQRRGYMIEMSFENYFEIIQSIEIEKVDTIKLEIENSENGYDLGEYVRLCIFDDPHIMGKFPMKCKKAGNIECYTLENDLSDFLENLDPCITLWILAEKTANSEQEVIWRFADEVKEGWVRRDDVVKELPAEKRILIVTEGSSDSFVLRKTIDQLYPDISDFFYFIDMRENYPFTGTGNLGNFCKGLSRIDIQNNIIVIFDNDSVGIEKYNQLKSLQRPKSFVITKLPDLPEFSAVSTIGSQGSSEENINGKAVAIECFLDFDSIEMPACIRWTSYSKVLGQYQGELENKEMYVKAFEKADLLDNSYNTDKLKRLIEYIISQWKETNNG